MFKYYNLIHRFSRLITKHKHISLLYKTNNVKSCCTTINNKKKEHTFDGPNLRDFIVKDLPAEQGEFVNNDDKIPYVDTVDLGQNRKGKKLKCE